MKTPAFVFILLLSVAFAADAADKPVAGTTYILQYNPESAGILTDADQISVVYAFDYWGTMVVQRLRGEGEQEDFFQNVLNPDEGRSFEINMVRKAKHWEAKVPIPEDVSLISYYFTDGERYDYNDRKTYISYIYGENGIPVRGARFRNIDFLIMAGKDHADFLDEIGKEIADYPDHFIAHTVYWRFRFFNTVSPDTLSILMEESERHYSELHNEFGDSVLNYKARSLNDINRVIRLSLREEFDAPAVTDLRERVNFTILQTIDAIPPEQRLQHLPQYESLAKYMLLTSEEREELERESRERFMEMISEFVGEEAPDFTFKPILGDEQRLSDFRGRYVFLYFWGSWCGPCVQEIPNLVQVYETFSDHPDFVMISVTNDASANNWDEKKLTEYTAERGMEWIQILDNRETTIHKLYNIQFWPNMFLIDKDGKVLQRENLRGGELRKTLTGLLDE